MPCTSALWAGRRSWARRASERLCLQPSGIPLCVSHGQALAAARGDGRTSAVRPTSAQSSSAGRVAQVCLAPWGATDGLRSCWVEWKTTSSTGHLPRAVSGTWLLGRGTVVSPRQTSKNECLGAIHFNSSLPSFIKWPKAMFPSTPLWALTLRTTLQLCRRWQVFCTRKLLKWMRKEVKMRNRLELGFQLLSCPRGREESGMTSWT